MAVNSVIQGTAADLIKRAMVAVDSALRGSGTPRARMILQIHDELLFEVARDEVEPLRQLVIDRMSSVADLGVPLDVNVGVGATWREAH